MSPLTIQSGLKRNTAPASLLDTHMLVYTPEGVSLPLRAAGPWLRAAAWLVDGIIRLLLLGIIWLLMLLIGRVGMASFAIFVFLVFWFYPVWFEVRHQGQTPAKRWLKLRVISANGAPVGWRDAISRNFLRTVDMLPAGYALGLLVSLFDPAGRRLGDMVAGTLVVHADETSATAPVPVTASVTGEPSSGIVPAIATPGTQVRPPTGLSQAEQQAIIAFAERQASLSPQRRQELAELLARSLPDSPLEPVARLQHWAAVLLGRA